jgi:ATP-binding cassette subfamily C protein CydC
VTFRLLGRLRIWLYSRLAVLGSGQLMTYRSADLLARLMRDVDETQNLFQSLVAPVVVAALTVAIISTGLWQVDGSLGIVALSVLVALGLGVPLLGDVLARTAGRQQVAARTALDIDITDSLHGLPDLLMLGRAGDYVERVRARDHQLGQLQRRQALIAGLRVALYLATLALLMLGAAEALQPLSLAAQQLGRTRSAAQRLWQVADERPAITFPSAGLLLGLAPVLEFDHVDFAYDGIPVLYDISFAVRPGRPVVLVGPSGAGKSTVLHLATRAWDPTAGQIRLGGQDLRGCTLQALAGMIASVSQDPYLFSSTVRHNLQLARPTATDTEIRDVLQRAGLADLVAKLPAGLDTWIGDQGVRLSGGERQKLALARGLLQKTPILLLDEVTANLDPVSEQMVFDVVRELARERTVLMATHRLGHLEWADTILALEAGHHVEEDSAQPFKVERVA